jgi:hypothetical protein
LNYFFHVFPPYIVYHHASSHAPFHLPFNLTTHPFLKSISKNSYTPKCHTLLHTHPHNYTQLHNHTAALNNDDASAIQQGREKHFSGQQRGMREFRIFRDALKSVGPATIQLYNLHVHGEAHRNSIDVKRVFRGDKPSVINIHSGRGAREL